MAGIQIGVASETRAFKQGFESGVIRPVEDAVDALEDLGKTRVGDKLESEMRDAQTATKKLGREVDDVADQIERDFKQAYARSKNSAEDFSREAGENVQGFKEEAVQNLSEVASSFTGDLSQMADGVQGLTGGLASSLTPGIGIPVAILGGAAGAFLASWQQSTEEAKERVSSMYRDMLESGQSFLSESFIQEAMADLADDTDKYAEALRTADDIGVSHQTVLRALVGDQQAIADAVQATNDKRAAEIAALESLGTDTQDYADKVDAVNLRADETISKFVQIGTETDTAAAKAATVTAAYGTSNAKLDEQVRKIQDIAAKLDSIGTKTIKIDADTTGVEGALSRLEGRTISVNVNGQVTRIGNQVW